MLSHCSSSVFISCIERFCPICKLPSDWCFCSRFSAVSLDVDMRICPNGDKLRSDHLGFFCIVDGQRVPATLTSDGTVCLESGSSELSPGEGSESGSQPGSEQSSSVLFGVEPGAEPGVESGVAKKRRRLNGRQ